MIRHHLTAADVPAVVTLSEDDREAIAWLVSQRRWFESANADVVIMDDGDEWEWDDYDEAEERLGLVLLRAVGVAELCEGDSLTADGACSLCSAPVDEHEHVPNRPANHDAVRGSGSSFEQRGQQ